MSKEQTNNPTRKDARIDNSKQTHARMRSQRLTIGATAATLMLAAGGAAFGYHLTSMSVPDTTEQSSQSSQSSAEASTTTETPHPN